MPKNHAHVTIQSRVEGKANICWTPGNYFWWLSKSEARSEKKKKKKKKDSAAECIFRKPAKSKSC